MSNLEMRINAICNVLVASNEEDRQKAVADLKKTMEKQESKAADADGIIRDLFMELGTPDHLIGYEYAVKAVQMCLEDRTYLNNIVKKLYPAIAIEFDTTNCSVERAIRHLVGETFSRGDRDVIAAYFGVLVRDGKDKVTNNEFLGRMVNLVKRKMRIA